MANQTKGNPWIIDTGGADDLVPDSGSVIDRGFRWVGGSTAGHTCVVKDGNDLVVWESLATAANFKDESRFDNDRGLAVPNGLVVSTISSGKLYIYF